MDCKLQTSSLELSKSMARLSSLKVSTINEHSEKNIVFF